MANTKNWRGGATAVAQVNFGTVAGVWAAADTVTTHLFKEDGSTVQSVSSTATGANLTTNVRDVHLADLQASTETLFQRLTFAAGTSLTIVATANTAGQAFHMAADFTAAGGGTYLLTRDGSGVSVLNEGPNDYWCDGSGNYTNSNWVSTTGGATTRPVNDDDVKILPHPTDVDAAGNPKCYAILYNIGVRGTTTNTTTGTTAVPGPAMGSTAYTSQDYNTLRIPESFRANVGDPTGGFYLKVDCTSNAATPGAGTTVIKSSGMATWISGGHTIVEIQKIPAYGEVRLAGGTTTQPMVDVNVSGAENVGKLKIKDSCVVTNYRAHGCPGLRAEIGTAGTAITEFQVSAGHHKVERPVTLYDTFGSAVVVHEEGATAKLENRGAYIYYNANDDLGASATSGGLKNYSGVTDFTKNRSIIGINVTGAEIWDGAVIDAGGLAIVTFWSDSFTAGASATSGIRRHGGSVQSETARIIRTTAA